MELQVKSFEAYQEAYRKSVENPEEFWAGIAENFFWRRKWNNVLRWNFKGTEDQKNHEEVVDT